jgi:enoyl-CoA hydratase
MAVVRMEVVNVAGGASIARLCLDRPESRNALNLEMCRALLVAATGLAARADVACVGGEAAGPVFCAGADLKERRGMDADAIRGRRLLAFRAYDAIERLPMPVIAAVDGPCVGSGCEIAAACDFIFASERASFRYPEAQWGTVGATQRLPRIVGSGLAKELLFTGRIVEAAEALRIGLVNRVVPAADLPRVVDETVGQIVRAPNAALRQAKRVIDGAAGESRYGALAHELFAIEENLDREDWKARMAGDAGTPGKPSAG